MTTDSPESKEPTLTDAPAPTESLVSDEVGNAMIEEVRASTPPSTPRLEVRLDEEPSAAVAGQGFSATPFPPAPKPPGRKLFVIGALIGALVGAASAAGVYLVTDDRAPVTDTIVVGTGENSGPTDGRNTSAIAQTRDIQGILAKVEPAVVAIQTGGGGAGTGFVISSNGVVVTNSHVIEGAGGQIEVSFSDGTSLSAEVLGRSVDNDLAVLKIKGENLPAVALGSSDSLKVGDEVVAIGNALALDGGLSVTRGIISGMGRTVPEAETGATLFNVLQTDAAINPGNSGGPLVNSDGEVVGINTALAGGSQNVGFAISIDSAKQVIEDLTSGKQVRTAFLGVETRAVTSALAKELGLETKQGALIRRITQGSAAQKGGMSVDDVIVAVGGQEVSRPDDVAAAIRRFQPGDSVQITVERDGKRETTKVELGVRPDEG